MKRFVSVLSLVAAVAVAAGCATTAPSGGQPTLSPLASTALPTYPPLPTDPPNGNAIAAARCGTGKVDLSGKSAQLAAVRLRYPALTDDRAAYALSLLPPPLLIAAGFTDVRQLADAPGLNVASPNGATLNIMATDVAPAEVAARIVEAATLRVVQDLSRPGDDLTAETVMGTVALDAYLRIATLYPESLRGTTFDANFFSQLGKRASAAATDPAFGSVDAPKSFFTGAPQFWGALAAFMGTDHYRDDPGRADSYQLLIPGSHADGLTIATALARCTGRPRSAG
jgi:hypothetical protein